MKSHRVNLTLSEGDYKRLVDAAAADGKLPSAFAADVLKAFLMRGFFLGSSEPSQVPQAPLDRLQGCICTITAHERMENRACPVHFPPPGPTRQQRRAIERKAEKRKG